jgi:hypothetical protein
MSEEQDKYAEKQMGLLAEELNRLQMSFDTRLLAAFLAGRAGRLHGILVQAGHMTKEDALKIWNFAGEQIENPPDREIKTMAMLDGEIFDPSKAN